MAISTKCSAKSEQIFNIYGAEYYGLSGREFKELENPFSRNKKTARYIDQQLRLFSAFENRRYVHGLNEQGERICALCCQKPNLEIGTNTNMRPCIYHAIKMCILKDKKVTDKPIQKNMDPPTLCACYYV